MTVQTRFTHGGNIHEILRKGRTADIVDFSANINPLGLPAGVRAAIEQGVDALVHYPDPAGVELRQALAGHYHVLPESLVLGNGAAELLYVLFHSRRPGTVLLPVPSFSEYERAARAARAEILYLPLEKEQAFRLDLEKTLALLPAADCLVLGNPNNPTGQLLEKEVLQSLLAAAADNGCFVVIDESFMDFVPNEDRYTCRSLLETCENLLILQSLTKFYALPGLRLGFALTNPRLAAALDLAKDPWNVNLLAQKAGTAAMGEESYQKSSRQFIREEKAYLWQALQKFEELTVYEPTVNFILINIERTGLRADGFRQAMLAEGILIRDCSNYPGLDGHYIRIAVKLRKDNDLLLAAMQKVLKGKREHD